MAGIPVSGHCVQEYGKDWPPMLAPGASIQDWCDLLGSLALQSLGNGKWSPYWERLRMADTHADTVSWFN